MRLYRMQTTNFGIFYTIFMYPEIAYWSKIDDPYG